MRELLAFTLALAAILAAVVLTIDYKNSHGARGREDRSVELQLVAPSQ